MNLEAELILELTVECAEPLMVGNTPKGGFLRVIPIIGGTFHGPGIKGKVLHSGADWNTKISDKLYHVIAKYCIETDDGEIIAIENEAYHDREDPKPYIRTTPRFYVREGSKYDWLCTGTYAGTLRKSSSVDLGVDLKMYKLK